ncbi:MAG TPA: flagellar biosynthesis protein FlhF [Steroidobacteraceae bacterium]|jgi:flagellar biosynthesis protein FlhF|nr:flagellar biosynthesis protein FlhF [Steroidobacteraceae bacterium]
MKIQRYLAKDMRSALTQVREALGPDAVILSSGRVGDEVEVVAAIDFESQRETLESTPAQRTPIASASASRAVSGPRTVDFTKAKRASSQLSPEVAQFGSHEDDAPLARHSAAGETSLADEVKGMRRMLEAQLATLTWNDMSRRSPLQAAMLKELARLGLSNELSQSLARKIPETLNFTAARRFALATIARTVQVTGDRWLEDGGRVAFAGPAGAGKTTLIAKLAARWVLRHGPRRIALVSADAVRIGAHEQMHMLGRLLGVTAHTVYDIAELPELLAGLAGQRLILIDTAGASPRDPELARRLRLLHQLQGNTGSRLESAIVLPASMQAGTIDEVLGRFAVAQPTAVCITKIDEAASLGGILSALVRTKLPAAYVSDGQRVPEDLEPARAHALVARAVDIAHRNNATPDDETMQRRIAGVDNGRA